MEGKTTIRFRSSISKVDSLKERNASFDSGTLRIAYAGDNRNGSSIDKRVFEAAIPSLYYCPVVANYDIESDSIGSHDMEIVRQNGQLKMFNVTEPVGLVPENAEWHWEMHEDETGVHEYLCTEVLLWKRQASYEHIKDNVITDESMEIDIKAGHRRGDGVYVIDAFEFLAFCLLESAEPCYESASLATFGAEQFALAMEGVKEQCAAMLEDWKGSFGAAEQKGGKGKVEEKLKLFDKYGISKDAIFDFDLNNTPLEELDGKLAEYARENGIKPPQGEPDSSFALTNDFVDELRSALSTEKMQTEWGTYPCYCYCDCDMEKLEVYAWDVEDWKLYGFRYSVDGDAVSVDFGSKTRKKFAIVDFQGGELDESATFSLAAKAAGEMAEARMNAEFSAKKDEMEKGFAEERSGLEGKIQSVSDKFEELNREIGELRTYQKDKMAEERRAAEDALFSSFADLSGNEAFEELKRGCADLSIEEVEEKCFALRGRLGTRQNFSANSPKLPVELPGSVAMAGGESEPYGGLFQQFKPSI